MKDDCKHKYADYNPKKRILRRSKKKKKSQKRQKNFKKAIFCHI